MWREQPYSEHTIALDNVWREDYIEKDHQYDLRMKYECQLLLKRSATNSRFSFVTSCALYPLVLSITWRKK